MAQHRNTVSHVFPRVFSRAHFAQVVGLSAGLINSPDLKVSLAQQQWAHPSVLLTTASIMGVGYTLAKVLSAANTESNTGAEPRESSLSWLATGYFSGTAGALAADHFSPIMATQKIVNQVLSLL